MTMRSRLRHWSIPVVLSLLIKGYFVQAGSKYKNWSQKYDYGQNADYKAQYTYLTSQQQAQKEYEQYVKQQQQAKQKANADDDDDDDDDGYEEVKYSNTNSYQDDPGFSYFLEGTAGCSGSDYNLTIYDLVVNCGDGDYYGYDPHHVDDYSDENSLYPERHYCQFDEVVTISGYCKCWC